MITRKIFFPVLLMLAILVPSLIHLSAHGYVLSPASRGYQGSLDKAALGYSAAFGIYGSIINEPGSLEAPKGFPALGPADGKIASANGSIGGDTTLDIQTADRWKKTNISTGVNAFIWKYLAYHATAKWHYYMTKQGWDPNKPLTRQDLELIGTVAHNGTPPQDNVSHQITVPSNRAGYHIILAVWDVADTTNAFYNVIDVNVTSGTVSTPPATPSGLTQLGVTGSSAKIGWTPQLDAVSYTVFRNGQNIQQVNIAMFEDTGLAANTTYTYEIQAKGSSGLTSAKSALLSVKTNSEGIPERPTLPSNLHSMEVTENSVSLMWMASTHSQGIKNYQVFENGIKVGETVQTTFLRTGLAQDTEYRYTVRSTAMNDQISDMSNELKIRTKKITPGNGQTYCGAEQYIAANAYPTVGAKVFYSCKIWKNKWYANPGELPGINMVWEEVSICTEGPGCESSGPVTYCGAQEYNPVKTYSTAGAKVFHACKIWENKWYANPGDTPGSNAVWKIVSDCSEGQSCKTSNLAHQENDLSVIVSEHMMNLAPESYYNKISRIDVITPQGLQIMTFINPGKNSMSISRLPSGIYFVKILYKDGSNSTKTIRK
ncbi:carbohydrate-binding protein [Chryseobacterium lactis]|uniref:Carbohydrate-binding protein n=1 Tax=Chryseobacterium lactis TaxID=1241981 RepID=A0A3G6RE76_CHRLC|nr:lytic polysaccharide monooxygenase [Chryseobacterium lactis]AZA83008.1 T9SS C-terminal target domain-containing protein [Chryseobacterium lactis]AZB03391.1 T9SS C-terminal target domain-containing protein [Chryseobacterium lactis]PNW12323.1 carbohydrate-binding protein [Chryseobacterium lactis]